MKPKLPIKSGTIKTFDTTTIGVYSVIISSAEEKTTPPRLGDSYYGTLMVLSGGYYLCQLYMDDHLGVFTRGWHYSEKRWLPWHQIHFEKNL